MSVRSFIQSQPIVAVVIAAVIIVAAWTMILRQSKGSTATSAGATTIYTYFDITTGELFESSYQDPPATGPSGPATGVLAHMFACGSCDKPADRFVGYVTTFADMPQPTSPGGDQIARAERPLKWQPRNSAEGKAIAESVSGKCDAPKACQ